MNRCPWCLSTPEYTTYHDNEWGKLVTTDPVMFEFLTLESAQAGLSWLTVLKKREGYKKAFANFDVQKVANFTDTQVEELMQNQGIIRNRLKIKAAISNAKHFIAVQQEFGSFCAYLLQFFPNKTPLIHYPKTINDVPARNEVSDAIANNMKKRGFKFFGTTICYAHLQATGYINDHLESCAYKFNTAKET